MHLRDRNGEKAAPPVGKGFRRRIDLRQVVGGEDVLLLVLGEPVEERPDLILVGGLAEAPAMVLRQDRREAVITS